MLFWTSRRVLSLAFPGIVGTENLSFSPAFSSLQTHDLYIKGFKDDTYFRFKECATDVISRYWEHGASYEPRRAVRTPVLRNLCCPAHTQSSACSKQLVHTPQVLSVQDDTFMAKLLPPPIRPTVAAGGSGGIQGRSGGRPCPTADAGGPAPLLPPLVRPTNAAGGSGSIEGRRKKRPPIRHVPLLQPAPVRPTAGGSGSIQGRLRKRPTADAEGPVRLLPPPVRPTNDASGGPGSTKGRPGKRPCPTAEEGGPAPLLAILSAAAGDALIKEGSPGKLANVPRETSCPKVHYCN